MNTRLQTIFILLTIGLFTFSSCIKEQLELPVENTPVFKASGTIGSEAFSIAAGDNGAYMHTMTDADNGVDVYSGNLMNSSISIEFGIYDGMLDIPNFDILQQFPTDIIFSQDLGSSIVTLSKDLFQNASNIQSVSWFANDVPIGVSEAIISEPGKYDIRGEFVFQDQSSVSLTNTMIVGFNNNATSSLNVDLNNSVLSASVVNNSTGIIKTIWTLDGDVLGENAPTGMNISGGLHTLSAEIHYDNQVVQTKSTILDASTGDRTIEDFSFFLNNASPVTPRDFNARLNVTHNGELFQSELTNNSSSSIEVASVELYGQNSNGKDVYKVSAVINGMVKGTTSNNILPVHIDAVFGIEAP